MISVPCPPQRFFLQPAVPDTLRVAARASCSSHGDQRLQLLRGIANCCRGLRIFGDVQGAPGNRSWRCPARRHLGFRRRGAGANRLFCTTMSTALMWGLGPAPICTAAVACLIWKSPARGDRDDQLRQVPSVVLTRPPAHPSLRDAGSFLPRRESEVVCKWGKGRIIHRHWVIGARRFFRDWR